MNPTLVRVWLRHSHTHIVRIHSAVRRLHCQGSFAVVVPCACVRCHRWLIVRYASACLPALVQSITKAELKAHDHCQWHWHLDSAELLAASWLDSVHDVFVQSMQSAAAKTISAASRARSHNHNARVCCRASVADRVCCVICYAATATKHSATKQECTEEKLLQNRLTSEINDCV